MLSVRCYAAGQREEMMQAKQLAMSLFLFPEQNAQWIHLLVHLLEEAK